MLRRAEPCRLNLRPPRFAGRLFEPDSRPPPDVRTGYGRVHNCTTGVHPPSHQGTQQPLEG